MVVNIKSFFYKDGIANTFDLVLYMYVACPKREFPKPAEATIDTMVLLAASLLLCHLPAFRFGLQPLGGLTLDLSSSANPS